MSNDDSAMDTTTMGPSSDGSSFVAPNSDQEQLPKMVFPSAEGTGPCPAVFVASADALIKGTLKGFSPQVADGDTSLPGPHAPEEVLPGASSLSRMSGFDIISQIVLEVADASKVPGPTEGAPGPKGRFGFSPGFVASDAVFLPFLSPFPRV